MAPKGFKGISLQDLAGQVCSHLKVDLDELEAWASKEGALQALAELKRELGP